MHLSFCLGYMCFSLEAGDVVISLLFSLVQTQPTHFSSWNCLFILKCPIKVTIIMGWPHFFGRAYFLLLMKRIKISLPGLPIPTLDLRGGRFQEKRECRVRGHDEGGFPLLPWTVFSRISKFSFLFRRLFDFIVLTSKFGTPGVWYLYGFSRWSFWA